MLILFYIFFALTTIMIADANESLPCESIICPMGSAICMYNKKSTDNLQSLAISVSCLTSNGTLTQNSDTVIPNPAPKTRTDITSFAILGLNTTKARQEEVVNAIIDIARRLIANQSLLYPMQSPYTTGYFGMPGYPMPGMPSMPGYPMPGMPSMPGYPMPGMPGMSGMTSPFVVNTPPASAPVIAITNIMPPFQGSAYSSFMNRNTCPNPPCINNLPPSPPTSSSNGNPNLMPTSLDTIYEKILQMRSCMAELEKAVQDASAAVPPPTYGPTNNVAFPVAMPYNPNVNY